MADVKHVVKGIPAQERCSEVLPFLGLYKVTFMYKVRLLIQGNVFPEAMKKNKLTKKLTKDEATFLIKFTIVKS